MPERQLAVGANVVSVQQLVPGVTADEQLKH